jgi:hypothetical protein
MNNPNSLSGANLQRTTSTAQSWQGLKQTPREKESRESDHGFLLVSGDEA